MSYEEATAYMDPFAPSVFGYEGVWDTEPFEEHGAEVDVDWWGAPDVQYGGQQPLGQMLGQALGSGGAGLGRAFIEDPYVQAQLGEFKEDCRVKAKQGVSEWVAENGVKIVLGAGLLIIGNGLILSLGVIPLVKRIMG